MAFKSILMGAALGLVVSCGGDCERTESGIEACLNSHDVQLDQIDYHYFDVESKLGYSNTPVHLRVEIVPAQCETDDRCYFEEEFDGKDMKYNGYFWAPDLIKVHLSNGRWTLEQSAYRFELNRYFKYIHGSEDWNCTDYDVPKPNCFEGYVR